MKSLKIRSTNEEQMDDPSLSIDELREVYQDINRINRFLNGNALTSRALWPRIKERKSKRLRIYDFGCGDGEGLRQLAVFLRKKGFIFELLGLDINANALRIAEEKSKAFPEISYKKVDILQSKPKIAPCDFMLCSLTLHHFKDSQIVPLLAKLAELTLDTIIVNDLKRSPWACFWFTGISRVVLKTKVARQDGLESVKSGFVPKEITQFIRKLDKMEHRVRWLPNYCFVWLIKKER